MDDESSRDTTQVLERCITAAERGDTRTIDEACRAHPDLADDIHATVAAVRALAPPQESAAIRRIDRFEIVRELGHGGAGTVFLAHDPELRRDVALKVIAAVPTPLMLERFRRETQAVARLRHPNIVAIHEARQSEHGALYFVMDFIDGASLETRLGGLAGRDPRTLKFQDLVPQGRTGSSDSYVTSIIRIAITIADALDHAHRAGLVHRDVKPGNILLDERSGPHLVDFGLAIAPETPALTRTGFAAGTTAYMAPEQIEGDREAIGPRTDVYALGVTLYRCLTLRAPFQGATTHQLEDRIRRTEPIALRALNPQVSRDVQTIVLKAMEKSPARRYASAAELGSDLRAVLDGRPIRGRPAGPIRVAAKWVRRKPLHASAVVAVPLIACIAVTWDLLQTRWQGDRAYERFRELSSNLASSQSSSGAQLASLTGFASHLERGEIAASAAARKKLEDAAEEELQRADTAYGRTLSATKWLGSINDGLRGHIIAVELQLARLAHDRGDSVREAQFRDQVRSVSAGRPELEGMIRGRVTLKISSPQAEVHLFRYVEYSVERPGEIPRVVPAPVDRSGNRLPHASDSALPGDPCLVITRIEPSGIADANGLRVGDVVLRIGRHELREPSTFVLSVAPHSPAEAAGVHVFDVVRSVNRKRIASIWDWETVPWLDTDRTGNDETSQQIACEVDPADGDGIAIQASFPASTPTPRIRTLVFPTRAWTDARDCEPGWEDRNLESVLGVEVGSAASLMSNAACSTVELSVLRSGVPQQIVLKPGERLGATVELTACPLVCASGNLIAPDVDGERQFELESGSYLAVVDARDSRRLRCPFTVHPGDSVTVAPQESSLPTGPAGFVWVPRCRFIAQGDPFVSFPEPQRVTEAGGIYVGRYEVTMDEWLEFMTENAGSDGRNCDGIDLTPRWPSGAVWGARLDPAKGRFCDVQVTRESPVVGVPELALGPFLAWKNRGAESREEPWFYRLPTPDEWELAARGADARVFPWGDRFDFSLCNSYFARDQGQVKLGMLEPVGSFATDESPFGLRDMAGSATEYNAKPFTTALPDWWPFRGGSWVGTDHRAFRAASRIASVADSPDRGLRLVAEIRQGRR